MREWLSGLNASDWISIYAAIVATSVLALEVWKYLMGGPRLKLMVEPPERHGVASDYTHVSITNFGSYPITVVEIRLVVRSNGKKYKKTGGLGYNKNLPTALMQSEQMTVNFLSTIIDIPGYWIEVYCSHRVKPYTIRLPDPFGDKI